MMVWSRSLWVGVLLVGCGGSTSGTGDDGSSGSSATGESSDTATESTDDSAGDSATTATTTDGEETETTEDTSTDEADATGDTGETGDDCDFEDDFGRPVEVFLENQTAVDQFVQLADQCNMGVFGRLENEDGPLPGLVDCWTCAGAVESACVCPGGGGPPCWVGAALKIEPGATYNAFVSSTTYVDRELPAACGADPLCGETCRQAEEMPPDLYTLRVTASDVVQCSGGMCDCVAGPEGWCFIDAEGALAGVPAEYEGSLAYPVETSLGIQIN